MPTPDFIRQLRRHIGHDLLWLMGSTLIVLRNDEVLLVRRSDNGLWAPISGIVDPGENPATTAVREAMEEASVTVEIERMVWLSVTEPIVYSNGDQCQFLDHGFLARWVEGDARVGDEESTEVGWFPVGDLPQPRDRRLDDMVHMVRSGPAEVAIDPWPGPSITPES